MNSKCLYCNKDLGFNSWKYMIQVATKPKGSSFRWKTVAHSCEPCVDVENNKTRYELGEELPTT